MRLSFAILLASATPLEIPQRHSSGAYDHHRAAFSLLQIARVKPFGEPAVN